MPLFCPPLLLLVLLTSAFPIPLTKRASLVAKETGFFPWRCWSMREGQGGFVSPHDDGSSACMFNRQTYGPKPNGTAHLPPPDYAQRSFWRRHFACFITPRSSRHTEPGYCRHALLMSTAETTDSPIKHGRHTCILLGRGTPGQINTMTSHTYRAHAPFFLSLFVCWH